MVSSTPWQMVREWLLVMREWLTVIRESGVLIVHGGGWVLGIEILAELQINSGWVGGYGAWARAGPPPPLTVQK